MKLKKIASLMLAGIMAVSMLTACGDGSKAPVDDGTETPDVDVSTSASADTFVAALSNDARNNVTAVANADLDAALEDAVEIYFNDWVAADYGRFFGVPGFTHGNAADARYSQIGKAVAKAMGNAEDRIQDVDGDKDATVAVETYAVNGTVSDQAILENLAAKMDESIRNLAASYDNDGDDPFGYTDSVTECDYEVSTSIVTATGKYMGVDVTVKFVSVAVERIDTAV